jgi:microcystin-dependent protein
MEAFVGQLLCVPYNFAPTGWAFCAGQVMSISQNTALFSLLGTMYGGDGRSTFGLPDLRGRVPIGMGQGPGLSDYSQGEQNGVESVTLQGNEFPVHAHTLSGSGAPIGVVGSPVNNVLGSGQTVYLVPGALNATLAPSSLSPFGGGQPHDNLSPYLTMNWIICLQGIFPARP